MNVHEIQKVIYLPDTKELYIKFVENVITGYDTVCFVGVDTDTVIEFKNAENREKYFDDNIRTHYKYFATLIELAEVQSPSVYSKARDIKTYEQYCAEQEKLLRQKDLAAMNAL